MYAVTLDSSVDKMFNDNRQGEIGRERCSMYLNKDGTYFLKLG